MQFIEDPDVDLGIRKARCCIIYAARVLLNKDVCIVEYTNMMMRFGLAYIMSEVVMESRCLRMADCL